MQNSASLNRSRSYPMARIHLENAPKKIGTLSLDLRMSCSTQPLPRRTIHVLLNSTFLFAHGLHFYPITGLDQGLVDKEPIISTFNVRLCASLPSISPCLTAVEVRCQIHPITTLKSSYGSWLSPSPFPGIYTL